MARKEDIERLQALADGWAGSKAVVSLSRGDAGILRELCGDTIPSLNGHRPTIIGEEIEQVLTEARYAVDQSRVNTPKPAEKPTKPAEKK